MARLLTALEDEIAVEWGKFGVIDDDGPPVGGPNWLTIGTPETIVAGPNAVALRSGGTDHVAAVRIESWDAEPPAEDGWETVADAELTLSSGVVRLTAVTAAASGRTLSLSGPGAYRLTAYSRGRAAAASAGPFERSGVETWLLRFRPRAYER